MVLKLLLPLLIIVVTIQVGTNAEEIALAPLKATLQRMRDAESKEPGRAEIDLARDQLRDWIEYKLHTDKDADENTGVHLTEILKQIAPAGADIKQSNTDIWRYYGAAPEVRIVRNGPVILVTASTGVDCGFESSIYGFIWKNESWKNIFTNKSDDDNPRSVDPKLFYNPNKLKNEYYILDVEIGEWCSSSWHNIGYQWYKIDLKNGISKELLSIDDYYFGEGETGPINISPKEVQITYATQSIDPDINIATTMRTYRIEGKKVNRVQPAGDSVSGFFEAWLGEAWETSARWSADQSKLRLKRWHDKFHIAGAIGLRKSARGLPQWRAGFLDFSGNNKCAYDTHIQQVGVEFEGNNGATKRGYFLIREDSHLHFTMLDVLDKARPSCMGDADK